MAMAAWGGKPVAKLEDVVTIKEQPEEEEKGKILYEKWIDSVKFSVHALEQIMERFKFNKANDAQNYIRDALKTAEYIGEVVAEDGNRGRVYGATNSIYIVVSPDKKVVVTVIKMMEYKRNMPELMRVKFAQSCRVELRKMYRQEQRWLDGMELLRTESMALIWSNKLLLMRTTSRKKKTAAEGLVAAAEKRLKDRLTEIENIQATIRHVAKCLVSML